MEFTIDQQLAGFIQTGSLIRFEPGTVFGTTNAHMGVVINANPRTQKVIVVVCATSQVQRVQNYANRVGLSPYTIAVLPANAHSHFSKDTAFNCNDTEVITYDIIKAWHTAGQIEVVTKDGVLPEGILNDIRAGVIISDLVEDSTKEMLTE
jgi:hypothetical protein